MRTRSLSEPLSGLQWHGAHELTGAEMDVFVVAQHTRTHCHLPNLSVQLRRSLGSGAFAQVVAAQLKEESTFGAVGDLVALKV